MHNLRLCRVLAACGSQPAARLLQDGVTAKACVIMFQGCSRVVIDFIRSLQQHLRIMSIKRWVRAGRRRTLTRFYISTCLGFFVGDSCSTIALRCTKKRSKPMW